MKKSLLTVLGLTMMGASFAQTPSASWSTSQNASFTITSAGIRFLDAVDPNVVWAAGYNGFAPNENYNWVSVTTNGGTNWTANNVWADTNTYVMSNLEGIDATTAWVSAYKKQTQNQGGIFRTTNGGTTWTDMTATGMYTNTAAFTNIVVFVTPSVGITQGDPIGNEFEIWRTTDGGTTWSLVPGSSIPNPVNASEYGLVNVYTKFGTSNIWFGTNKGRIYYSADAGLTWAVSQLPTMSNANAFVNDIAFTDAMNGVAYVNNSATSPATFEMFYTTNGGVSWTKVTTPHVNVGRNDVSSIPGTGKFASVGAATGNNIISYSNDNGITWTDWGSQNIQYLAVDFVDASNGWAGSFSDQSNPSVGGVWKYSGTALTATTPTANFSGAAVTCTGAAYSTTNTSMQGVTYTWSVTPTAVMSSSTAYAPTFTFATTGTYTITMMATNAVGSSTVANTVSVSTCAGLNETVMASNLFVYPNPASDYVTVKVAGQDNYNLTLINVLGKVVYSENVKNSEAVNVKLSGLAKGIYFLTVENKGEKATRKIIVE